MQALLYGLFLFFGWQDTEWDRSPRLRERNTAAPLVAESSSELTTMDGGGGFPPPKP